MKSMKKHKLSRQKTKIKNEELKKKLDAFAEDLASIFVSQILEERKKPKMGQNGTFQSRNTKNRQNPTF